MNKYYTKALETQHDRRPFFERVINEFLNPLSNPQILEIGCCRNLDEGSIYGDGHSSIYWADFLLRHSKGSLTIVDYDKEAIENCKIILADFIGKIEINFIIDDGLKYLQQNNNFDFVYLDGPDNPEWFTFECFKLIDRSKTFVLCDDANGWERGLGKCPRLRQSFPDYEVFKCNAIHEMIFYDIAKNKITKPLTISTKSKLYICGITQNRKESIQKIIDVCAPYVDGFVWTDHYSNDGTYELLEENKKKGKIYQQEYSRDHDFSANRWLRSNHIKNGDWCFILDSTDLPNEYFIKGLKESIVIWEKNQIDAVFGDRPWLIRYNDCMFFYGTPHWGVNGIYGKVLALEQQPNYRKENYLTNNRNLLQSAFLHPAKYWFEFGRSNQCQLLYAHFSKEIWENHERARLNFRFFCQNELKIELTLNALIDYLIQNVGHYPSFLEDFIEHETNLKDIFRLNVLNHTIDDLIANRMNWSYFKWKNQGAVKQEKNDGFIGLYNQYNRSIGREIE